jgi:hypothetical protein
MCIGGWRIATVILAGNSMQEVQKEVKFYQESRNINASLSTHVDDISMINIRDIFDLVGILLLKVIELQVRPSGNHYTAKNGTV